MKVKIKIKRTYKTLNVFSYVVILEFGVWSWSLHSSLKLAGAPCMCLNKVRNSHSTYLKLGFPNF